jgi:6-phosphogluconolactonase
VKVEIKVLKDAEAVAREGAATIAVAARHAISARGSFTCAVSGGHTPWVMLRALAEEKLPWDGFHIVQVDERVAPADSPDRNLHHLHESLLDRVSIPAGNVHAMPVEAADLAAAASAYGRALEVLAGSPPRLDLVHLGLGPDGHTASLIPGDPVLEVDNAPVGLTGPYQGHPRMTLTYPVLDNAARILFVVTGAEKVDALVKLRRQDPSIPAGRVRAGDIVILADEAAAGGPEHG